MILVARSLETSEQRRIRDIGSSEIAVTNKVKYYYLLPKLSEPHRRRHRRILFIAQNRKTLVENGQSDRQ
jgi:hypothetical protein